MTSSSGRSLQTTLGCAIALVLAGRLLSASAPRVDGEDRASAAIAYVAEVEERISAFVSEIERLASASDVPESEWRRLYARSRELRAALPLLRRSLSRSLRIVREALTSRYDAWWRERQRAGLVRELLAGGLRRLSRDAPALVDGQTDQRRAGLERHESSFVQGGSMVTGRLHALVRAVERREADRSRQLEELERLGHELDRVASAIGGSLDLLESELPALEVRLAVVPDVLRHEISERLEVLGLSPRDLARSLESIQGRILSILKL